MSSSCVDKEPAPTTPDQSPAAEPARPRTAGEALAAIFNLDGFVEGPPPWGNPELLAVDEEEAKAWACPLCSGATEALSVHRPGSPRAYRQLLVCRACGTVSEF